MNYFAHATCHHTYACYQTYTQWHDSLRRQCAYYYSSTGVRIQPVILRRQRAYSYVTRRPSKYYYHSTHQESWQILLPIVLTKSPKSPKSHTQHVSRETQIWCEYLGQPFSLLPLHSRLTYEGLKDDVADQTTHPENDPMQVHNTKTPSWLYHFYVYLRLVYSIGFASPKLYLLYIHSRYSPSSEFI